MKKLSAALVIALPLWNGGATQLQDIEKALVEAEGRWATRKPAEVSFRVTDFKPVPK